MKIKQYLKLKLRNFLESILEMSNKNLAILKVEMECNQASLLRQVTANTRTVNEIESTFKNTISLAMDIHHGKHEPTWGIICYKHKGQSIVHKFELGDANGEEIKRFLEQYKTTYKHLDAPYQMKDFYKSVYI